MDPLSLTASLIAVVGAAATIAKQLEVLRSTIQNASTTLCSLTNEISDLRVVLGACETAIGERYTNPHLPNPPIPLSDLGQIVESLKSSLADLDGVLSSCLIHSADGKHGIRVAKLKWIREKSNAQRLQNHVRQSKLDLLALLESHSV